MEKLQRKCLPRILQALESPHPALGETFGGHDSPEEQSVSHGALNLSMTQKHLEGCGHTGAGPSPEG